MIALLILLQAPVFGKVYLGVARFLILHDRAPDLSPGSRLVWTAKITSWLSSLIGYSLPSPCLHFTGASIILNGERGMNYGAGQGGKSEACWMPL